MLIEINPSLAHLSYDNSTVEAYVGGRAAKMTTGGVINPLTVDDTDAGTDERIMGLYFTSSLEDGPYSNDETTLVKLPVTVKLQSGNTKHNLADGYPYAIGEAWVPGDRVFLGYDGLWHRTAQMGSSAGSTIEYGVVDAVGTAYIVVTFRDPTF